MHCSTPKCLSLYDLERTLRVGLSIAAIAVHAEVGESTLQDDYYEAPRTGGRLYETFTISVMQFRRA